MQALVQDERQLKEVPRLQRRPATKPLTVYTAEESSRDLAMALAYLSGDHTMRAIAEHFGVHYMTVSRAVKRYEQAASASTTP